MTELLLSTLFGPVIVLAGLLLVYQNAAGLWRARGPKRRTAAEWEATLDADVRWVADAKAELWRSIEHLAEDRDEMPPELQEVADDILQLADLTERAAARRMVDRGLVPARPLFQPLPSALIQSEPALRPLAASLRPPTPSEKRLRLVHSDPGLRQDRRGGHLPDVDWVDGRPVPQVR